MPLEVFLSARMFNNEDCHCNVRLGIMKLLIDNFNLLQALYKFEQVYRNIPFARLILFPNITEEDLE